MRKRSDTFHYPKSTGRLEKYIRHSYALPERSVFLGHCLADMDEFMGLFFSEDFAYRARRVNDTYLLPNPGVDSLTFQTQFVFMEQPKVRTTPHEFVMTEKRRAELRANKELRGSNHYLLTQQEIDEAKAYLDKNPQLKMAVSALQSCFMMYFSGLEQRIERLYEMAPREVKSQIRKFSDEANNFSFIHDLLPAMALSVARSGGEISQHSLGKALCDTFRLQGFKSHDTIEGRLQRDRFCPFAQHITKLFSRALVRQDDGTIGVLSDQKPGSLLHSIIALLEDAPQAEADLAVSQS